MLYCECGLDRHLRQRPRRGGNPRPRARICRPIHPVRRADGVVRSRLGNAAHPRDGWRLVRTPDQSRGGNCASLLLHGRRPSHRDPSPVREEVGEDTAQGARDRTATNEGSDMTTSLKQFKRRALSRPSVKAAYDASAEEFAFLDEVLRARAEAGLTQAEVAELIGTTQSAIARLESAEPKHSPSIATLQKYAKALGYTVQVKLVKERRLTTRSSGPGKSVGRSGAHGK